MKRKLKIPRVDSKLLVRDATKLMAQPTRRRFLKAGGVLCALLLLTGCDVVDEDAAEGVLRKISKLNDAIQARLFDPNELAPMYPESAIKRPFQSQRSGREQEVVEAGGPTRLARDHADHPPCLRGGLERDRQLVGHPA